MRPLMLSLCATALFAAGGTTGYAASPVASEFVAAPTGDHTIVDVASDAGTFGTLLAAAEAAGLADLLASEGPFTVLAPTDDAFAALPEGTVEKLLSPEGKTQLVAILKYHVIAGRVSAADAIGAGNASTALEQDVVFGIRDGQLFANDSRIVANDIEASNGIIHVIDAVLIPENLPAAVSSDDLRVGIYYDHPSSNDRVQLGLGSDAGIEITSTTDGSGARDAGLQEGDIIVSINGAPATLGGLDRAKVDAGVGGTIEMLIARRVKVEVRPKH